VNLAHTASRVVQFVAQALYVLIIVRIFLSWMSISPWNPFMRFLRAVVDPILRPFRRILPTFGGIDFSPLLAILVIFFLANIISQILDAVAFGGSVNVAANVVILIGQLLDNIIIVLGILVLIRLLLGLFSADPFHPLVMGIRSMTNPLVRPFAGLSRRRIQHGGLDVPAAATLVAYVVLYLVVNYVFNTLLARLLIRG
jgi:YggT family protein